MNHEEQTLIDGLFSRLRQAEAEGAPRDAQAQAHIAGLVQQHAAAPYYMAQAILVQEAALKRLDEQNRQLQAELAEAKARATNAAPAQQSSGGFLSSIFGSSSRLAPSQPAAAPAPSTSGGWRDGPGTGGGVAPQSNWGAAPPQAQAAPARGGASSFLGGALQTAAGVAGGVMLAQASAACSTTTLSRKKSSKSSRKNRRQPVTRVAGTTTTASATPPTTATMAMTRASATTVVVSSRMTITSEAAHRHCIGDLCGSELAREGLQSSPKTRHRDEAGDCVARFWGRVAPLREQARSHRLIILHRFCCKVLSRGVPASN